MHFKHDNIFLWYGMADTPAEKVQPDIEVSITIGVQPIDASNNAVSLTSLIERGLVYNLQVLDQELPC